MALFQADLWCRQSLLLSSPVLWSCILPYFLILRFWAPDSHGHCIQSCLQLSHPFFVCECKVQQSTFPHYLLYHLYKEVVINALQILLITNVLLCCPPDRYWSGWSPLWGLEPANTRLLLSVCISLPDCMHLIFLFCFELILMYLKWTLT